jgi:hypothetical protein
VGHGSSASSASVRGIVIISPVMALTSMRFMA